MTKLTNPPNDTNMLFPKQHKLIPWCKTNSICYTFFGTLFGLIFPAMAIWIDIYRMDLDLSLANVVHVHEKFPIHFIIDTAPFFLGLFAYFCGKAMDKIEEKNDQLLKVMEFKDVFLANMSHEIRTPMAGIIGIIDLFSKSRTLNEEDKNYLEIIRASSNDLMKIINDILDFSKLRAGKLSFDYETIDVRKAVEDVQKLFLAVSKTKNIALKIEFDRGVPKYLLLDDVRLKQILSNLVGNAIKFSSRGQVTIKVSHPRTLEGHKIKFEIIDQGIGIRKEDQDVLFTEYRQLDNYKSTKGGSGLGLSICKKLVEHMGGELGVISNYGKGSNFWFTLKTSEVNKVEEDYLIDEKDLKISEQKSNLKVLMAEDNKTLCKVYEHMLEKLGCESTIVHDGEILIDSFKENYYDIILLDINMPKIDGIEAMTQLKANFKNLPPIIGISASALSGDEEKYIEQGLNDYLTKPFTIDQLTDKLQKWSPTDNLESQNTDLLECK